MLIEALTDLFIIRGVPPCIRSDNGPELIAQAVMQWIKTVGAEAAYIEPGSPRENGYCESFNARFKGRTIEWGDILYPKRSPGCHRTMAEALQHEAAAFSSRIQNTRT